MNFPFGGSPPKSYLAFLDSRKTSAFSAFRGFNKQVVFHPCTIRKAHLLTNMEMTRLDFPAQSIIHPLRWKGGRTGAGVRFVVVPPKTGFIESIRYTKNRQVAFWRDGAIPRQSVFEANRGV